MSTEPAAAQLVDTDSKEVEVRVVSKANLDPSLPSGVDGEMEVSIGGVKVTRPYYIVMQVTNSGNRSITASDVEMPLTIAVGDGSIAQAQILRSEPAALKPGLDKLERQVVVRPLLLNPGDSFQLGVLTSGSEPNVSAQARIAGIKDVRVVGLSNDGALLKGWLNIGVAMALMSMYATMLRLGFGELGRGVRRFELRRGAAIPLAFVCALGAMSQLSTGLEAFQRQKSWSLALTTIGLLILIFFLGQVPLKRVGLGR